MSVAAHLRGRRKRVTVLVTGLACAALPAGLLLAGCGSSSSAATNQSQTAQTRQVLITVKRAEITKTVSGSLKITTSGSKPQAKVTVTGDSATDVAAGQTVTAMVGGFGPGNGSGGSVPSGMPSPGSSGMPAPGNGQEGGMPPQGSGQEGGTPPQGGAMPSAGAGQAGTGQNGAGPGMGGFGAGRGGTKGKVISTSTASDGTVTAVVRLSKMPSGAKVGSSGFASISVDVLASDVLVLPTRAIATRDGASTVQVLVNGDTVTRTIETGESGGGMTEVTSGLKAGDNVVYVISFPTVQGGSVAQTPGAAE
jgi:hypothetical protein